MNKFKYLIIFEGVCLGLSEVKGTNNLAIAKSFADCDNVVVIDTEEGSTYYCLPITEGAVRTPIEEQLEGI